MAETLKQIVTNKNGITWIRTHATDTEFTALCQVVHSESEDVTESEGDITCPDCIEIIKKCKLIKDKYLKPEYDNELFWKRLEKNK